MCFDLKQTGKTIASTKVQLVFQLSTHMIKKHISENSKRGIKSNKCKMSGKNYKTYANPKS